MIVPAGERTTEQEMQPAVVAYLMTCSYGAAKYRGGADGGLFFNLRRFIKLTDKDLDVSNSRANERKWHAVVRNVYRSGLRSGLFVKHDGGLQLASRVKR